MSAYAWAAAAVNASIAVQVPLVYVLFGDVVLAGFTAALTAVFGSTLACLHMKGRSA